MPMLLRIYRSPEETLSTGDVAVIEQPETEIVNDIPENQGSDEKVTKKKETDWELYEKISKKPDGAKYSKKEMALLEKYEGKDDSTIEGYPSKTVDKDTGEELVKETETKAEVPEKLKSLVGDKSPIGAKSMEELPAKVEGLVKELQKLNGKQGEFGRALQKMGVQDVNQAIQEIEGSRNLHKLVQDLKAGKKEAFEFLGMNNQEKQAQGEYPDDILDEGLFNHINPQLKKANDTIAAMQAKIDSFEGVLKPWQDTQRNNAMESQRNTQVNNVINEVSRLAEVSEHLWDKSAGSLRQALTEYYGGTADSAYNPALKNIVSMLELAEKEEIKNLDVALSYWERKNGNDFLSKTREDARNQFLRKPTVGLSDQHGGKTGNSQVNYTEAQIRQRIAEGKGTPTEFNDPDGTINPNKVPRHLRALLVTGE